MQARAINLALHIQEICACEKITVKYCSLAGEPVYMANRKNRKIVIRPTKSVGHYISSLHELGHILGIRQSKRYHEHVQEIWAWIWALDNALVWNKEADRIMYESMQTYGLTDYGEDWKKAVEARKSRGGRPVDMEICKRILGG